MTLKIIYRRILIIILPFLFVLSLTGYYIYYSFNRMGEELLEKSSLLLVKSVEEGIYEAVGRDLEKLTNREKLRLRRLMSNLATREGNILSILLIDTTKTILISNDPKVEGSVYRDSLQIKKLKTDDLQIYRETWTGGVDVYDVIVPIQNKENINSRFLRVVLSRSQIETFLADLPDLLIPVLLALGLIFVISLVFVSKAYKQPLSFLNKAIAKLNEEDYSYRVKYAQQDEFSDTFSKLNKTIEKVGYLKEGYKKAERRIFSLLQSVNESILVLDLNKYVTSYNDAALEILKTDRDEFSEKFAHILDMNFELNGVITQVIREGNAVSDKKTPIFLSENTEIFVKMNIQPLIEDEKILGVVLTLKDMKLINELENNLLRSMKFGVITNLASSISHEIKNPLSALALHSEILDSRVRKLAFEDKEQAIKSLDTLQNEVKRLNRIIQQFLSLAKPSNLELKKIDLNNIVREVLHLVQQQAQEQNISFNTTFASDLEPVYGDEDQLKQVLLNILLNAFAAIGKNGKIYIRSHQENNKVFIDVRDTGKGMSKKVQEKVFDLYFTTKNDGGGIGMAVSKNIMEAHDGKLYFDSVEGKGTIFTIEMPSKDYSTVRMLAGSERIN